MSVVSGVCDVCGACECLWMYVMSLSCECLCMYVDVCDVFACMWMFVGACSASGFM